MWLEVWGCFHIYETVAIPCAVGGPWPFSGLATKEMVATNTLTISTTTYNQEDLEARCSSSRQQFTVPRVPYYMALSPNSGSPLSSSAHLSSQKLIFYTFKINSPNQIFILEESLTKVYLAVRQNVSCIR